MNDNKDLPLFPDEIPETPYTTVADVTELAEGESRAFPVGKIMVAIFLLDGKYYAIDDFCPHQGASLAGGYTEDCTVFCPLHHWRFSLKDGTWLDNPKIAVGSFKVRISGGKIQVQVPEDPA